MDRRAFLALSSAATAGAALSSEITAGAQSAADVTLTIAPLKLEIAPGKVVHTVAYNDRVPGPLLRWPEGKPIAIDVLNGAAIPEIVHWHGLWIPLRHGRRRGRGFTQKLCVWYQRNRKGGA